MCLCLSLARVLAPALRSSSQGWMLVTSRGISARRQQRIASGLYKKARGIWRAECSALRRSWLLQHAKSQDRVSTLREKNLKAIAEARKQRQAEKEALTRSTRHEREIKAAEFAVQQARRRLKRAKEEAKRQQGRERQQQQLRRRLIQASRSWIYPEQLEDRIQQALDNPQPLYQPQYASPSARNWEWTQSSSPRLPAGGRVASRASA